MLSTTTLAVPPAMSGPHRSNRRSRRALSIAAACWCCVAIAGQLVFAAYVLALYGGSAAAGRLDRWSTVLQQGWVPGHAAANTLLALHLLFTVLIIMSGAVQLVPQVRRHAAAVHRWNGRLYVTAALLMGTSGLVMLWTRHPVGDLAQHVATSVNGVLIVAFAALAWLNARAGRVDRHRRWALRLLLVVSGVWFFRIGLMAWLVLNQGPVGFDPKTFEGPFLTFLGFAQFLLPLAVLEGYLRACDRAGARGQVAMAALLAALTLLTAVGIAAATLLMWLPNM